VIRCDVKEYGYIGFELIHTIELKAAELKHIKVIILPCHLVGETFAYVSGHTNIKSCLSHHMMDE